MNNKMDMILEILSKKSWKPINVIEI
jgi:hypothetical protein